MCTYGPDAGGTVFHDKRGGLRKGTRCIADVIDKDDILSFDITDDGHGLDFVGTFTLLIADYDFSIEVFRKCARSVRPTHIGRCNGEIRKIKRFNMWHEDDGSIQMVYGNVKEALNLCSMEVHGHDAVRAGGGDQVGNHFSADGYPGFVFTVLPGKAEVGHHRGDVVCRSTFGRVDHQQQLKQVIRWLVGRLDQEYVAATDGFVVKRLDLAVAEMRNGHLTKVSAIRMCD